MIIFKECFRIAQLIRFKVYSFMTPFPNTEVPGWGVTDDCKNPDSMNENKMNFQYLEVLDSEYLNVSFELKEIVLSLNEENIENSSSSEEKV